MTAAPVRARANRVLLWVALLATVLGVLLGQALVTLFNATLL